MSDDNPTSNTDAVPVVDNNGTPIVDPQGSTVTVNATPNASTASGAPAVLATEDNVPAGSKPDPSVTPSIAQVPTTTTAPDDVTTPSQPPAVAPISQGSGVGSVPPGAQADNSGDPVTAVPPNVTTTEPPSSPADAKSAVMDPAPAPSAPDTPVAQATQASTAPGTPGVPSAPSASPASDATVAATPPETAPVVNPATAGQLTEGDPEKNPNVSTPGTTSAVAAQATDHPDTPNSVSTDTSVPSDETLNPALTTTVDATTVAKAQGEQNAGATAPNTPAKVLGDAVAAPAIASTNAPKDPSAPLVVSPAVGDGLAVAKPETQEGVADISHGAAEASDHDVVVAAPAAGNGASDGGNAGAVDPTGYITPVRVSAAGVPATDPTLQAVTGQGTLTPNPGAGTSSAPSSVGDSLGDAATAAGTNGRINGGAQNADPGNVAPPSANNAAQTHAVIEAMTGSPRPASTNDATLAQPVPAGDTDAAGRVADLHGADAPDGSDTPSASASAATPASDDKASDPVPQAVATLQDAGVLPAALAPDIAAKADPSPLASPAPDEELFFVHHHVMVDTVYKVHARDGEAALALVKAGGSPKAKAEHSKAEEDWEVEGDD